MLYTCENCKKEMNLGKEAKFCPVCGKELEKADVKVHVVELFNEGLNSKKIASKLAMSTISVDQILARAALNGDISATGLIQEKYGDKIRDIMDDNWDGQLKTIKKALPDCTYVTINYYVRSEKRKKAQKKQELKAKLIEDVKALIKNGVALDKIMADTGASGYLVERLLVEEIKNDKSIATAYINLENESKILELSNDPAWDKKLKTLKEKLPETVSYAEIKAVLAKNH